MEPIEIPDSKQLSLKSTNVSNCNSSNLQHKVDGVSGQLENVGQVVDARNDDQKLFQAGQVALLDQFAHVLVVQSR
jgi:hypothetical protein